MTLTAVPLGPGYVARLEGLVPGDGFQAESADHLHTLFHEYKVILIRGMKLDPEGFIRLAGLVGELEPFFLSGYSLKDHPEIYVLSNVRRDGSPIGRDGAGTHWHSDSTFVERPSAATLLQAIEVPDSGGDTLFADCQAAYDALPEARKAEIEGLKVIHRYRSREYIFSADKNATAEERAAIRDLQALRRREKEQLPPSPSTKASGRIREQIHPLVRTHPATGRKGLYLNEEMMFRIDGWAEEASADLLRELCAHATQPQFIYRHKWQPDDIVIWDNAAVIHAATYTPPDQPRTMHRLTTAGQVPV